MENSKKSAHLPPMRIPKNEVGKMKIVPINDKKGLLETWFLQSVKKLNLMRIKVQKACL